jgi:hypothetical protein
MSLLVLDTLLMLLDDTTWFLPAYMDAVGFRLQKTGRNEEAWDAWSSAEGIYIWSCNQAGKQVPEVTRYVGPS